MTIRHFPLGRARLFCVLFLVLAAACGDPGGGTGTSSNPTPGISALNPAGVMQRSGAFTLTVNGTDFVPGSVVRWKGLPRPTTVVSATQLTAQIAAADVEQAGPAEVSVFNPAPGGGGANVPGGLRVDNPQPVLTAVTPAQAVLGQQTQEVRITGTGFVRDSYARFDGEGRIPVYVSPTELRLVLEARDLDRAGTFPISVTNFGPGGGLSNNLNFTVISPPPN